ncbi:hypothetical protein D3C71_1987270 [compost metagenome]
MVATTALAFPAYQLLVKHFPDASPMAHFFGSSKPTGPAFSAVMQIAMLVLVIISQWRLMTMVEECRAARRTLERKALNARSEN